ncbi:MAG: glutaredoxin domain-containing protein [Gammaproteobacteria bacterium]
MSADPATIPASPLPVALYLMPGCGTCYQVKGFLARHGVPVELRWITEPANQAWVDDFVASHGRAQAPFLVVGEDVLQGYQPDAMRALLARAGHVLAQPAAVPAAAPVKSRVAIPADALWVSNFLGGSVSFVDPATRSALGEPVAFGAESNPVSVAFDPESGVVAVSDMGRHCVVFFDRNARGFLHGTLEASTLATPRQLGDLVFDARRRRFYVGSVVEGLMLAIDSTTGRFANGTAERSSVAIGTFAGGTLLDPVNDRIYVRTNDGVLAIDLQTFAPLRGSLEASTLRVGAGRNLAFDATRGLLYLPAFDDRLVYVDAARFDYAFGDRLASSIATERAPFGVAVAPGAGLAFVTCVGTNRLHAFDAAAPRASSFAPLEVSGATRTLALLQDDVLAATSFDDGSVALVDARTLRWLHGDFQASRIATGEGPRGMAWVGRWHAPR